MERNIVLCSNSPERSSERSIERFRYSLNLISDDGPIKPIRGEKCANGNKIKIILKYLLDKCKILPR
jgi:hypothetical protein